jgi:hypothetical protein
MVGILITRRKYDKQTDSGRRKFVFVDGQTNIARHERSSEKKGTQAFEKKADTDCQTYRN